MASWTGHTPWYMEARASKALIGRQRRRRAWIALGVAVFVWMTAWGGRNLLG